MKAIILSAGLGERLKPLTNTLPKPLLPVGNKTLIEYHIDNLVAAGIPDIVINVSYLGQQIIEKLQDGVRYGANIQYSLEKEPLETGGGILQALPLLGSEPFLAVSADIFTRYDFKKLINIPISEAHLVLTDNPPYHLTGDFAFENQIIRNTGQPKFNFAGIGVLSPRLFEDCMPGKFPLAPLLRKAVDKQAVSAEYFGGYWYNVGTLAIYNDLKNHHLIS